MLKLLQFGVLSLVIAGLLIIAPVSPAAAGHGHGNPNPGVVPLNATPNGKSYAEWSAAWWQYVFSIPAADNPLFDENGEKCGVGQSGPVFFLVGVFNSSGAATRACTVPAGKKLFFPILNVEDNFHEHTDLGGPGEPPIPTSRKAKLEFLTASVNFFMGLADESTLKASVDRAPLKDLSSYKVFSPPFAITLPAHDDLETAIGFPHPPRRIDPVLSGGYWIMLEPLSPGEHIVKFSGTFNSTLPFTVNIEYDLTVKRGGAH